MYNKLSKTLALLMATFLIFTGVAPALSYDSGTPYEVQVNYLITADSSFTVDLAGSETSIDFNGGKDSANVEPDSQVAGSSVPIATISNTGNVQEDFALNLTAAQFGYVVVTVSGANDYSNPLTLSNVAQSPTGWTNVNAAGTVDLYAKATFTAAPGGTTSKTLRITSADST